MLALITGIGALLRVYYARTRPFWIDEMHTQQVANYSSTFAGMLKDRWTTSMMQDPAAG